MHTFALRPKPALPAAPAPFAPADSARTAPRFGHDFSRMTIHAPPAGTLQAKLVVGAPDDEYEQEADRVADRVMRMPEGRAQEGPNDEPCAECRGKTGAQGSKRLQAKHAGAGQTGAAAAPSLVQEVVGSAGKPLDPATRATMEPRFGHDFSGVRIHTGHRAAESAKAVNALAYTVGQDIVFGEGQFAPSSPSGQRLLAHELAHTVQQARGLRRNVLQRYGGCSSAEDTTINGDHARARTMLTNAIAAVRSYNGTTPTKVRDALARHFHGSTSSAFASWINVNLRYLWATTWMAGYRCFTGGFIEKRWACKGTALATTFWCVPGVDIRLCPSYFGESDIQRSKTLIHEWVHKYGCNFDLGYEHNPGYSGNRTLTQLLNADSFAAFVRDVQ